MVNFLINITAASAVSAAYWPYIPKGVLCVIVKHSYLYYIVSYVTFTILCKCS